ncbi:MAG: GtrA family protein [Bacteroidia bacterium]|nr:GtrA family protein [Bacteroidia bacterium]
MSIKQIQRFRLWLRQYPTTRKFLKFGIVGATSATVSLSVFWLMSLQYPALNLLSKAIGYVMGFFVGFTLNKFWTYIDQTDDGEKYLLKYILVYAITFMVYLVINFVFDHYLFPNIWVGIMAENMNQHEMAIWLEKNGPLVSNVFSIFINVFLNFFGTNKLVFKIPEPDHLFE